MADGNVQMGSELIAEQDVARFLYREALLMDEGRYAEWLSLWTGDAVYWVPCNDEDYDPRRHVSIIYDDRTSAAERVERLQSGTVLAQEPRPKMRRLISNIETVAEGGDLLVASNFMLGLIRLGQQQLWIGRTLHTLRRADGQFLIARARRCS